MCLTRFWPSFKVKVWKQPSSPEHSLTPDELSQMREKRINFYESKVNPIDRLIRQKWKEEDSRSIYDDKVENMYDKVKWE